MSLQGISNQVSRDFCEVYILLIIFLIKQTLMILVTYFFSVLFLKGVRARMVDKDLAPKVSSAYVISLLDKWGSNIANIAFKNPI